jgi:N-acetylglutamate synthase-like GNAT family acetyltransferase
MGDVIDPPQHGCNVRDAIPGDATGIVSVFREAMPAAVVAVNVLGAPRAADFVDRSIAATGASGSDRFWVAENADRHIVAFAQLRLGLQTTFINNIHVVPDYQGIGIGNQLMRIMAETIASPEVGADVFDGSTTSAGIFERAGFRPTGAYRWHLLDPDAGDPGSYVVHDLPQADVVHDAFGVSMIRVETDSGNHTVGRIGPRLFRLTGASPLKDPWLRPALAGIDPERSVLAIVPDDEDPLPTPHALQSRRFLARRTDLAARYGAPAEAVD